MPDGCVETTLEIKKSKFIARAARAGSREDALALLQCAREDFPDARHHCWAYVIGNPASPTTAAMSDDGEPTGTAGKPILNVLQHKQIGDIMVIVIRYFGGIKLGAGGLVRAYAGATQQAIEQLALHHAVVRTHCTISTDFRHEQLFRHWASQNDAAVLDTLYSDRVTLSLAIPRHAVSDVQALAAGVNSSVSLAADPA